MLYICTDYLFLVLMIPKKTISIILGLFLISILVVDFQFKQLESLQVSVSKREMSQVDAVHKEMFSGIFSGAVLTYGTSTISYRLYGITGLASSGISPIIVSAYLKIVEFWRRQAFPTAFPLFYLFGSGLGFLFLAIEFTFRGVNSTQGNQ